MLISVILSSKNEAHMLKRTIDGIRQATCTAPYEIIVVDDGSADGSCAFLKDEEGAYAGIRLIQTPGLGIARARNLGVANASGDILVFLDAHSDVEDHWLDVITDAILHEGADGVSPAFRAMETDNPHFVLGQMMRIARSGRRDIKSCGRTYASLLETKWMPMGSQIIETPILAGGCTAVTKSAFDAVGGYDPNFRRYGVDEEELSLKLWLFGFTLKAVPFTCISHMFRPAAPYAIHSGQVARNRIIFGLCHLNAARLERLLSAMPTSVNAREIHQALLNDRAVMQRRAWYHANRKYDDDWFFDRFNLAL